MAQAEEVRGRSIGALASGRGGPGPLAPEQVIAAARGRADREGWTSRVTRGGPMDILELMIQQHHEAVALFEAFAEAPDDERPELAIQLAEALTLHLTIEERWIYPIARRTVGEEALAYAEEEHDALKRLILAMLRARNDLPALGDAVRELEQAVREHAQQEERAVLPRLGARATEQGLGLSCADIVKRAAEFRREALSEQGGEPWA
ncbi:hemerythrin domain-containing protein [Myxococcaceae bacterium JPH2]|nr:hemerythrin domain-containing protein [Myxococcaceae bacterium JPH2]